MKTSSKDLQERNPYFVLGLPVPSAAADVERAKNRILSVMEAKQRSTHKYNTPWGPQTATPDMVRKAAARLGSSRQRLLLALWASAVPSEAAPTPDVRPVKLLSKHLWWWA